MDLAVFATFMVTMILIWFWPIMMFLHQIRLKPPVVFKIKERIFDAAIWIDRDSIFDYDETLHPLKWSNYELNRFEREG